MRKLILAAAVAATGLAGTGLAAPALASSPAALVDLPGSEVRRSTMHGDERREEVLQLHADGTLTGNYQVTRSTLPGGGVSHRQGRIRGSWTIVGERLCFAGTGLGEGHRSCYRVSKSYPGKRQFAGVNVRTGEIWQMFVFPDEVR